MKKMYLSYSINEETPTYGNRNKFSVEKKSSIANGDVANDSFISSTVHIGTHLDLPSHFYGDGQTILDYDIDFWFFENPLFIEIKPVNIIIGSDLINILNQVSNPEIYDILIVKTGICHKRDQEAFWKENYGFSPEIYEVLKAKFPNVRLIGFDSISVSSFSDRMTGRAAHKAFLNPERPILLLEDMDLTEVNQNTKLKNIIVSPLRIDDCDGLPCTVFGELI